jgi:hypothetical protein
VPDELSISRLLCDGPCVAALAAGFPEAVSAACVELLELVEER